MKLNVSWVCGNSEPRKTLDMISANEDVYIANFWCLVYNG